MLVYFTVRPKKKGKSFVALALQILNDSLSNQTHSIDSIFIKKKKEGICITTYI